MTREEYIEGKRENLQDFITDNEKLIKLGALKNMDNLRKTLRMIDKAKKMLEDIDSDKFWDEDKQIYFDHIYKHMILKSRKQDITLF